MGLATFEYGYFVRAPVEQVYAHLADPASYVGLSPLVISVRDVERSVDNGLIVFRYRSIEQFHFFGVLRYDNRIRVTMTLTRPNAQIVSDVDSPLRVKVRFVFDLRAQDGGTWMQETVTAQSPGIVQGYVVSEAKRVQQERERILKARLEQAG